MLNLTPNHILNEADYDFKGVIKTVISSYNHNVVSYLKEVEEICNSDYMFPFLSLPIFWQEIIILIYMALKLHKYVKNNSRVIAIGESPLKLVFIQQVFSSSPLFSQILTDNKMANDIDYSYFSISRIGLLVDTKNMLKSDVPFDIDKFIRMHNKDPKFSKINKNTLDYFISNGVDPSFIIKNNKKIYFQDRCEFYRSIIGLMFIYSKLCDMQNLTKTDRLKLYQNIYIIGFDFKFEDTPPVIIDRINNLIYIIITQNTTDTHRGEDHFININFKSTRARKFGPNCINDNNYSMFSNQFLPIDKIMRFLSLPEKSTFNKSRCAKSINISEQINIDSETTQNNKFQKGEHCNIINACIMIFIYELGDDYISNIVQNLDNISEDRLLHDITIDFHSINMNIKEKLSMTLDDLKYMNEEMGEEGTDYNNNIFNNILLINQMKVIVILTIMEFISIHGIFSKCTYVLPLKTDNVSADLDNEGGSDEDD